MKTIPKNLNEIVDAVKPQRMASFPGETVTLITTYHGICWTNSRTWEQRCPADDAYAACVVALLGRMKGDTIIRRGQKYPLWGIAGSGDLQAFAIDADILTALYAAFVARPDLFGEAQ